MRVDGHWLVCDDGIVRPVVPGEVLIADGSWQSLPLLVDTAADRTVFSGMVLSHLGLPIASASQLGGVGGAVPTVEVATSLRLKDLTGARIVFQGRFAAFPDPAALDMSVLGRDILNLFALIVDRPRDVVRLLGTPHGYAFTGPWAVGNNLAEATARKTIARGYGLDGNISCRKLDWVGPSQPLITDQLIGLELGTRSCSLTANCSMWRRPLRWSSSFATKAAGTASSPR
jgi:hypothetical protein